MLVYLDDLRDTPEGWVRAYTVPELIDIFREHASEITHMSLDHDLGYNQKSGYEFMRWLEIQVSAGKFNKIPNIEFHTANPVGRDQMELVLQSIKRILHGRNHAES